MTRSVHAALCDGLDEAARGLWPSAAESFAEACRDHPDDARPALALAICHLKMGQPTQAVMVLESHRALRPPPSIFARRHQWLCAAARYALDDPAAAARALTGLPWRRHLQFEAHLKMDEGDLHGGVMALLSAFR